MIIMYGIREHGTKESYLATGYACCAFIIIMFINGLMRVVWGAVRIFELGSENIKGRDQQVQSEDDIGPLQQIGLLRANTTNDLLSSERRNLRNPSIQIMAPR
jgi:hypothetical protein